MSFISVHFGYNQTKLFNTNCEIAPLLDAIHSESYKEMRQKLSDREEFFQKEIQGFKKEQTALEKKLEKLETPPEPPKPPPVQVPKNKQKGKDGKAKKKTKKELEEERLAAEKKAKEEEEERLRKEEEERKRLEEEEVDHTNAK